MTDFFSDLPGWAKTAVVLLVLGGSNVATNLGQYVGVAAPVKQDFAAVQSREAWCFEQLAETQKKLESCWQECAR